MVEEGNGYRKASKVVQKTTWRTQRRWASPVGSRNFCSWQGHMELLQEGVWGLWQQKGFQANQAGNHLLFADSCSPSPELPMAHPSARLLWDLAPDMNYTLSTPLAQQGPGSIQHASIKAQVLDPFCPPCQHLSLFHWFKAVKGGGSQLTPVTQTSTLSHVRYSKPFLQVSYKVSLCNHKIAACRASHQMSLLSLSQDSPGMEAGHIKAVWIAEAALKPMQYF